MSSSPASLSQKLMASKPTIIFVLGPPASGKGTLSKRLASEYCNFYHLSAGDYLRFSIANGTLAHDAEIVDSVKSGGTRGLVQPNVIVPLLMQKIKEEMLQGKEVFLLDGFPRDLEQDKSFREAMEAEFWVHTPDLTILISCKKDIAKPRYIKRKRGDDDEKLFDQRYADYERRDMKVVDLYRRSLVQIDTSEGLHFHQSYHDLLEALRSNPVVRDKCLLPTRPVVKPMELRTLETN